jgi:puromycin-sensitive aminopeptidase
LLDESTASSKQLQLVASVVIHEMSHQWFGNLVTMQWWDDLWLNEGFANWAETWGTDKLYPQYKMWDQFITDTLSSALQLDSLRSSHPIQIPIFDVSTADQYFDDISYQKGASVVRMIQSVIGEENFRAGLIHYMEKYAYSNTETFDLWAVLEEVSNLPIGTMMASWTEQLGYPLVRVLHEEWQDDQVTLELDQVWFLKDGSELNDEDASKMWTIPLKYVTDSGTQDGTTLMESKNTTLTVPTTTWMKLNAGQIVPMRVLLGPLMLERLSTGIKDKSLSPADRSGVLDDAYALTKAGHSTPGSTIRLLANYYDEDEYIVWQNIGGVLIGVQKAVASNQKIKEKHDNFARGFVMALMQKVGWEAMETDGHLTTLLRSLMVTMLVYFAYDDPSVIEEATARFSAFLANTSNATILPSDYRGNVFEIVVKNGGREAYEQVKSYYYETEDDTEKSFVFEALAATTDADLTVATLDWSISGDVKTQDICRVILKVGMSSSEAGEITWKYFQDNYDAIMKLVGGNAMLLTPCVYGTTNFNTNEKADEVASFFKANRLPSIESTIAQRIETIRSSAKFTDLVLSSELSEPEFWDSL